MSTLIIGGSGFLGRHLCKTLIDDGEKVIIQTRDPLKTKAIFKELQCQPLIINSLNDINLESHPINNVVMLSGTGIVDKRWTQSRKEILINSRVQPQLELKNWLDKNKHSIDKLLIGSAIGFYGFHENPDHEFNEASEPVDHFVHQLCH